MATPIKCLDLDDKSSQIKLDGFLITVARYIFLGIFRRSLVWLTVYKWFILFYQYVIKNIWPESLESNTTIAVCRDLVLCSVQQVDKNHHHSIYAGFVLFSTSSAVCLISAARLDYLSENSCSVLYIHLLMHLTDFSRLVTQVVRKYYFVKWVKTGFATHNMTSLLLRFCETSNPAWDRFKAG